MAFVARQVAVGTTATLLTSSPADNVSGSTIQVANRHATGSTFLGGAAVLTSTGYELKPAETLSFRLDAGEALYGIALVASTAHVLESGV